MRIYSISGLFVGVMLFFAGLACAFLIESKVTLSCFRGSNIGDKCVISSINKFRTSSQEIQLSDITGASFKSDTGFFSRLGRRSSRSARYRLVLNTKSGSIPLTGATRQNDDMVRAMNQINGFVKGRSRSLKIDDLEGGLGATVGAILIVAGVVLGKFSIDRKSEDDY
ncbi:MAG TPA: hypothetical protein VGD58_21405 [Herpetosiphonaceae bacterium]